MTPWLRRLLGLVALVVLVPAALLLWQSALRAPGGTVPATIDFLWAGVFSFGVLAFVDSRRTYRPSGRPWSGLVGDTSGLRALERPAHQFGSLIAVLALLSLGLVFGLASLGDGDAGRRIGALFGPEGALDFLPRPGSGGVPGAGATASGFADDPRAWRAGYLAAHLMLAACIARGLVCALFGTTRTTARPGRQNGT